MIFTIAQLVNAFIDCMHQILRFHIEHAISFRQSDVAQQKAISARAFIIRSDRVIIEIIAQALKWN